jgi:hypothetical protein
MREDYCNYHSDHNSQPFETFIWHLYILRLDSHYAEYPQKILVHPGMLSHPTCDKKSIQTYVILQDVLRVTSKYQHLLKVLTPSLYW